MRVALVLDASAILAYARADLAAGELLGEVADDAAFAALPALALAEARADLHTEDEVFLLELLARQTPVALTVPLLAADAVAVGSIATMLDGRLGLAHAVAEVYRHESQLLTAHGKLVRDVFGELDGVVDL